MTARNANPPKNDFARIATFLSIAATATLLLSIWHEYFYFLRIRKDLFFIETTSDYTKIALKWMPVVVIGQLIALYFKYFIFNQKIYRIRMEKKQAIYFFIFAEITTIIANYIVITIKQPDSITTYAFMLMSAFILSIYLLYRMQIVGEKNIIISTTVITALILTFAFANESSVYDLRKFSPASYLKTNSENELVVVLRTMERGLLVRRPIRNQIALVPWDQVKEIALHQDSKPTHTLYEKWFKSPQEPIIP